ncbi:MAG: NAD-dependent DNA ligase LigA [Opitutaceae bacterium]|nr:NAD-dependent DNA ligase LigA [Opitutaceae bacterium]
MAFRGRWIGRGLLVAGLLLWAGAVVPAEASDPAKARERILHLRAEIARHDELYFKHAAPEISDAAYDTLKRELHGLEAEHPDLLDGAGPAGLGDDRSGRFPVYRHRVPMTGLDKSYSEAELRAFHARVVRRADGVEPELVVEPKYDGLALGVTYESGRLVRAVTRGNGTEGDDVTANARMIAALPRELRSTAVRPWPEVVEVRGEVYLTYGELARINAEREQAGEPPLAHPRNVAAGTLKLSDPAEVGARRLAVVFYGLGACEPETARPESQGDLLATLAAWGLPVPQESRVVRGWAELQTAVAALGRARGRLDFPTDGVVVKVNERRWQQALGVGAQTPRWAIAHKFAPARVETRLRGITIQVGRTGLLTPVAELEPVKIAGATIARASLHNRAEIARKDIRVGDVVRVEKAGEIIPMIVGVNLARRPAEAAPYGFPTACPACGTETVGVDGEAAVRCPNADCPAQVRRRLEHFASKSGVDIHGLGPAWVDLLVTHGAVRRPGDLYRLQRDDWLALGRKGGLAAERLPAAVERSKQAELWRFIQGLGIPRIGEAGARRLARRFDRLEALAGASPGEWAEAGLGPAAVTALAEYFSEPANRALVADLQAAGIKPRTESAPEQGPLAGKIFVLTGSLPQWTRLQAADKIRAAGGLVREAVSRRTDYVVAGEGAGEKLAEARRLGVAVLDESELRALLNEDPAP